MRARSSLLWLMEWRARRLREADQLAFRSASDGPAAARVRRRGIRWLPTGVLGGAARHIRVPTTAVAVYPLYAVPETPVPTLCAVDRLSAPPPGRCDGVSETPARIGRACARHLRTHTLPVRAQRPPTEHPSTSYSFMTNSRCRIQQDAERIAASTRRGASTATIPYQAAGSPAPPRAAATRVRARGQDTAIARFATSLPTCSATTTATPAPIPKRCAAAAPSSRWTPTRTGSTRPASA